MISKQSEKHRLLINDMNGLHKSEKNDWGSRSNEHLTIRSGWAGLIKHGEIHTFT